MISEPSPEPAPPEPDFAEPEEAREAIANLQPADHTKLLLIARCFARARLRNTIVEPHDLLHDAVVKTLDGRRRWNRRVDILKHLDRVMESDAGHVAAQRDGRRVEPLTEGQRELPTQEPDPERSLQSRKQLDDLYAPFGEDPPARRVLHLKSDGLSASEIRCKLGMGKTQYETVTKRIRRRLAKHLAKGGK